MGLAVELRTYNGGKLRVPSSEWKSKAAKDELRIVDTETGFDIEAETHVNSWPLSEQKDGTPGTASRNIQADVLVYFGSSTYVSEIMDRELWQSV
jgi:hypothetical protein